MFESSLLRSIVFASFLLLLTRFEALQAQVLLPTEIDLTTGTKSSHVSLLNNEKVGDSVQLGISGLSITKVSGKTSPPCGMVVNLGAKETFALAVVLDEIQVPSTQPNSPPNGVHIRFDPNGQNPFSVVLGVSAKQKGLFLQHGKGDKPLTASFVPMAIPTSFVLYVYREGSDLRILGTEITKDANFRQYLREIHRVKLPTLEFDDFEIACTKSSTGKLACACLVKKVIFSGDDVLKQSAPKPPFITWTRAQSSIFWLTVLFLVGYGVWRAVLYFKKYLN
jgi:hypothetical protein